MVFKKKQFWGSVIALALLAFCLKDISLKELHSLAQRLEYLYTIPAVFCTLFYVVCRSLRWRLLISPQKSLGRARCIGLYSAGQVLNIVMPALTGQVGRMFLFSRKEQLKKTIVFSTIVLEILFDALSLIVIVMIASLAFAFPQRYRFLSVIFSVVTIMGLAFLYWFINKQDQLEELSRRYLRQRWPSMYITIKKFVRSFTKGIELLKSTHHFSRSMLYSIVSWLSHTLTVYFLFKSFGLGLPFASAAVVMVVNTIAMLIPITPGNAGTFEVAVSTTLLAFSVPRSDAVLFALALHLLDLLPIFLFGFLFVHLEKVSISEISEGQSKHTILDEVSEDGVVLEQEEQT